MGNYTDPSANYAWFGVYSIYMLIGAAALFFCYKFTKERVVATAEQTANVKATDLFLELKNNRPLVILGFFFMLAFTFMFFMNTVNGFSISLLSVILNGWERLVLSPQFPVSSSLSSGPD